MGRLSDRFCPFAVVGRFRPEADIDLTHSTYATAAD